MDLNNLLDEPSEWSKAGSNLGKLVSTKIEISIAKAEGELKRVALVENKTTELFKLKLDLKIQELKNELNDITPKSKLETPVNLGSIPSQEAVEAADKEAVDAAIIN